MQVLGFKPCKVQLVFYRHLKQVNVDIEQGKQTAKARVNISAFPSCDITFRKRYRKFSVKEIKEKSVSKGSVSKIVCT